MIHKDESVLCTATVHLHAGCPAREAALLRTCAVSKTSVGPQFVAPLGITTSPGSAACTCRRAAGEGGPGSKLHCQEAGCKCPLAA